jgi:ribose transport system substrate-binding protein
MDINDRKRFKMNLQRYYYLLMILGMFFLAACYFLGVRYIIRNVEGKESENKEGSKHYVAMITKSTTSSFWKSVFAGANAASTEYNLTITMDGPENEEDFQTQNQMIEEAVENGAEVIVFSAVDFHANREAIDKAAEKGVKIVVIDSDVNSDKVSCRISTDNYQAGRMAGAAVLSSKEDELNVGIVNFDKNSANGQQREKGFRDELANDTRVRIVDAINVLSTTEDSLEGTCQMLEEHPEINVIATFNEWTSLGVGYAIEELGLAEETMVVAFDSNVVSVGMLEAGEVDALIVQNPYAMGYLGVECAYNLINALPVEASQVDTATTVITRENMFDEECQKVLFVFD